MYAIIETGGKQYRVQPGDELKIEKLAIEENDQVSFDKVLLVGSENDVKVGTPHVEGVSVKGTVLSNGKNKKLIVFKYKNKTKYRRFRGHRQPFSLVRIDSIDG
ncbi:MULTISPECIES: 50S ribosomal protein L21 [Dethiosulfovibrio]|jgi:large subunit ribosomal protein L21|uniref:Large ribosomal subunit protein bL21 n=2 Tax=Dethiosulfovibrio TaxID=47054 RepID=A0ABS9ELQ3_9BACT|nr:MULTISPECIES: 50S ribosomal protein L21 [Dethiosulfovibrio]MCF4113661.1 50S ribosomal protein L21 [Dethiosulfovibrio russensis]MCF4142131.1 50S ribosomal protein L21 [Dethiosulfovibrio marinus]MCF4144286.1 50S ribosomal protein L21 [Dethiosulfovibrio acidaminovorans]MEA3283486.1 50S ribosomal protein L21 [Synergistota bacterium]